MGRLTERFQIIFEGGVSGSGQGYFFADGEADGDGEGGGDSGWMVS